VEQALVIPGTSEKARFLNIAEVFIDTASAVSEEMLQYWADVARGEVPAVTTRECRGLLRENVTSTEHLAKWVSEHSKSVDLSEPAIRRALLHGLVGLREIQIERAIGTSTDAELVAEMTRAGSVLAVLRLLIVEMRLFRDEFAEAEYRALFKHFVKWANFTNHPQYKDAREHERAILNIATSDASANARALLEFLEFPLDQTRIGSSPEGIAMSKGAIDILKKAVIPSVLARFREDSGITSGIRTFLNIDGYLLLKLDGGLYDEHGRQTLAAAAALAAVDSRIQSNFFDFLRLVQAGLQGKAGLLREDVQPLARDRQMMGLAWRAATAGRIQPRMRHALKELRATLVAVQGDDKDLVAPPWLDATD
jgi:hypothetical protein